MGGGLFIVYYMVLCNTVFVTMYMYIYVFFLFVSLRKGKGKLYYSDFKYFIFPIKLF